MYYTYIQIEDIQIFFDMILSNGVKVSIVYLF